VFDKISDYKQTMEAREKLLCEEIKELKDEIQITKSKLNK